LRATVFKPLVRARLLGLCSRQCSPITVRVMEGRAVASRCAERAADDDERIGSKRSGGRSRRSVCLILLFASYPSASRAIAFLSVAAAAKSC
jgi:hypothetical protein